MPFSTTPRSRLLRIGLVTAAALCALSIIATGCGSSTTRRRQRPQSADRRHRRRRWVHHRLKRRLPRPTPNCSTARRPRGHGLVRPGRLRRHDRHLPGSGEKDWIEATVTIDGETYENVGMRLKGNSSIMGLGGGGMGGMGPWAATGTRRPNSTTETVEAPAADGAGITERDVRPALRDREHLAGIPRGCGRPRAGAFRPTRREGLPWLIDLDKNVDGQNHEGVVEFVVRSNTSETSLNEAVSLELLEVAGLASQEAVCRQVQRQWKRSGPPTRDRESRRLWMAENFDISGALYKAESTGDYSYRGDDPDSYDEVFDQEAGKDNADLTPLIEFLDFINNSDDATFNAELPDRLDVDSFATYLAMEELLANFDDIDGPGNNSYLYYDTKTGKFTVVAWDHNLAFGTMGGAGRLPGARTQCRCHTEPRCRMVSRCRMEPRCRMDSRFRMEPSCRMDSRCHMELRRRPWAEWA